MARKLCYTCIMSYELKQLRKKLGLSQAEMADVSVISRSKLALIETGKRMLTGPPLTAMYELIKNETAQSEKPEITDPIIETARLNAFKKLERNLRKQEHELNNLVYSLKHFKEEHVRSINALTFIREELRVFSGLSNYSARLQKMYAEALKKCLKYSAEKIEFMELRIEVLRFSVERYRNKLV